MKSTSVGLSLILSLNLLTLAGCGGGGSADTAVSASPTPPAAAAAGTPSTPTAPAAPIPSPSPSGIALAGSYPTATLTCGQGSPMYWQRDWTVQFTNGGTFRLDTAFSDSRLHVWSGQAAAAQGAGTATFRAPTTDGGSAWITVDGTAIVGAGYTGPASEIRCGTELAGATEPAQRIAALCELGPTSNRTRVSSTFTIDRSTFPWRSVTLDPNPDLVTDAGGTAVGAAVITRRDDDGTGTLDVRIGGVAEFDATHYRFQPNGDLELATRPSRQSGAGDIAR
jgi:hypothetical protein